MFESAVCRSNSERHRKCIGRVDIGSWILEVHYPHVSHIVDAYNLQKSRYRIRLGWWFHCVETINNEVNWGFQGNFSLGIWKFKGSSRCKSNFYDGFRVGSGTFEKDKARLFNFLYLLSGHLEEWDSQIFLKVFRRIVSSSWKSNTRCFVIFHFVIQGSRRTMQYTNCYKIYHRLRFKFRDRREATKVFQKDSFTRMFSFN